MRVSINTPLAKNIADEYKDNGLIEPLELAVRSKLIYASSQKDLADIDEPGDELDRVSEAANEMASVVTSRIDISTMEIYDVDFRTGRHPIAICRIRGDLHD